MLRYRRAAVLAGSTPGKIHISEAACLRLQNQFEMNCRGEIEIKGKGLIMTYFLEGRKTLDASLDINIDRPSPAS